ncbi:head maturation protease, ClpP-related [Nitrosomonas sp.]|uniref:head maturation protease, ClpP-related n=1 Tax=Nitrosomonas sp. TaxID=42353 RepID=UPI0025D16A31|nr:head maturation protease, ClpP-related [Nitrosomonas sp.]MBV6447275.1 ATP-dependent Clp protease proteolytic subunit [Nitrosomonas sp.]
MTTPTNNKIASESRTWYSIKAKAGDSIEVFIYDEIGLWGITASNFVRDLKAADDGNSAVVVSINSPGGDLFDGFAIHNTLVRLGDRCTARIDGVAASSASVIACGASQVVIASNAMMMIHNPSTFAYGTAEDLRKTADMVDKARDGILASYRRKAPSIDDAELIRMLDDETWLTAEEAVALGFADTIGEKASLQACAGSTGILARFKHTPKAILEAASTSDQTAEEPEKTEETEQSGTGQETPQTEETSETPTAPAPDHSDVTARSAAALVDACVSAGMPEIAKHLLKNVSLNDEAAVAAEANRVSDIKNLCITAKLPELASGYVIAGLSAEAARSRLFALIVAESEGTVIDNKEPTGDKEMPDENHSPSQLKARAILNDYKRATGKK